MSTVRYAKIMGAVFLIVGILGFIPGITRMEHGHGGLAVEGPGTGYLLGLFHVNMLHNIVHIVFGVLGLSAARSVRGAKGYAQFVAISYLALAVLGLIPTANTWNLFGLVPLHGNDVWLHAAIGVVSAYFGFARAESRTRTGYVTRPSGV
jgi:hypothetical protein